MFPSSNSCMSKQLRNHKQYKKLFSCLVRDYKNQGDSRNTDAVSAKVGSLVDYCLWEGVTILLVLAFLAST